MRIGIFAPYDLARAGGVNTQIRAQARALRAIGHEVHVYGPASAPLANGEVAIGGITTVTFGGTESGLGLDPRSAWRVARILKRESFDIVHVHEPLVPIVAWCAVACARAPVVGTFHVHREDGHRFYPLARPLLAPLARRLAYRIAVSDAARRTVSRYFPGDYDIVSNGIEVDAFRVPRPRPACVDPDRQHVLFVGRLEPRKGVEYLIRAMAVVRRTIPRVRLLVVGDGPDRDRLAALAGSMHVDATFAGRVEDIELPAYFQWSDVISSPALGGESFGIVLLEAMACEKPIVASRIDGYIGLAGDADCGPLVPPGDADALAVALTGLLARADVRRVTGARGLAVARRYDWPALALRLAAIYERVHRGERASSHVA